MDGQSGLTQVEGHRSFDEPHNTSPKVDVSPLEQIRYAEMVVTRRVAAAHESARVMNETTQQQADGLKREAEQAGRVEGQAQYAEALAKAQEAASTVLAQAQRQAEQLQRQSEQHTDNLVDALLEITVGAREADP